MKFFLAILILAFHHCRPVQSTPPSFIQCVSEDGSPKEDGPIVIYNNATWLECSNGSLVIQHCISLVNDSYFECVPHETVLTKTKSYLRMGPPMATMVKRYFTDATENFVNCHKLKKEMGHVLRKFTNKQDCTTGMEKLSGAEEGKNDLCSLKRKVYYVDDDAWYSCKNGVFELQKCVFESGNSYSCIDKTKIEHETRLWEESAKFHGDCKEFFNRTDFSDFANYLEPCDAETNEESQALPLPEQPAANTDGRSTEIGQPGQIRPYLGGRQMLSTMAKCKELGNNVNGIWYECNMPTKCVVRNKPNRRPKCITYRGIEVMFRDYQQNGAWDDTKFNEIKESMEGNRREIYESLESGDANLFKKLSNLVVPTEADGEKIVTIKVKRTKTEVTPQTACKVIMDLAPFSESYIQRRIRSC